MCLQRSQQVHDSACLHAHMAAYVAAAACTGRSLKSWCQLDARRAFMHCRL